MTDAENTRQAAHAALDKCLDALELLEQTGQGAVKWGKALIQVLTAVTCAAQQKRYGRAVLEAAFAEGLPIPSKAIEAGFITSIK